MRVFVYGTLKRGFPLHEYINDAEFVGEYATPPKYSLFDTGPYPAMTLSNNKVSVKGEVYQVSQDQLAILDMVEGVPELFVRKQIQCGKYGRCYVYVMVSDLHKSSLINSGEWK